MYRDPQFQVAKIVNLMTWCFKGVVNCQNSRDKGPREGNSACG